jgi:hypothetical protein
MTLSTITKPILDQSARNLFVPHLHMYIKYKQSRVCEIYKNPWSFMSWKIKKSVPSYFNFNVRVNFTPTYTVHINKQSVYNDRL